MESVLGFPFTDIPTPAPQRLDDLGRHSRRKRYSEEDEALVYGVCERQLCPYTYTSRLVADHHSCPTKPTTR